MRILNPLLLNDWEINKTLQAVVLIQAAVLLCLCLAYLGFGIPMIQVPISFAYLTFIPGILLLRVLRLHKLGNVRTLLYSMGLSLSLLMAAGIVLNTVFLRIGFPNPMSLLPLAAAITSLVLVLCVFSYVRDREFSNPVYVNVSSSNLSPQILLFCLLPFLTIFATFLMNQYGINSLQMVLLLIIMAIPFVVVLGWIPQKHYAFLLFVISFALLFHTSLISSYVWGSDLNAELVLSTQVLQSGVWNLSIASNFAGMLSVVMLLPIYSLFSGISLVWVFKILFPFIFSFVPLGLFIIYKRGTGDKITGDKIAFLSCFFFMTFEAFFVSMPSLGREEIAELFLILIVLLVVESQLQMRERSLLLIIFGASLSVSHYGTAYVFLLILAAALPIIYIALPRIARVSKTGGARGKNDIKIFVLFFAVFTMAWYLYVSPFSEPFVTVVNLGSAIASNVGNMFTPTLNQPVAYLTSQLVPLQVIERDIVLLSFFFILVGLIAVLADRKKTGFADEYMGLASGSFLFLFLAAVVPFVASALQSDRLITLLFIFLAPFCIIGLIRLPGLLSSPLKRVATRVWPARSHKNGIYMVAAIFLAIWVVFNSAFIYQLFDQPKVGRFALDNNVDFLRLNGQELANAQWLSNYHQNGTVVYADVNKLVLISGVGGLSGGMTAAEITPAQTTNNGFHNSYVFLGTYNLENKEMLIREGFSTTTYVATPKIPQASAIFDDGGSTVLLVN
jgi:uncharacterized membrane protein